MRNQVLGGRYRIQERIGEGGMAYVYVALDEKLGRRIAIKVLHEHMAQNPEIRKRFQLEARAVSALEHPNIVKIYDFSGADSPRLWLVTEILSGANLAQFVQRYTGGWLHPVIAICIVREICKALDKAHRHAIVHRDIKPENIMVTDIGRVKLMDFGIAKDMQKSSMTMTGTFIGSPSYMSPEQIRGRHVDHRSDLYSLGVLFYEIITGRLPYTGQTTHDVVMKIVEGKYTPPRHLVPTLPAEIDAMITTAMQREPERRFDAAETWGQAIDHFLASHGFVESHVELERFFSDRKGYEAMLAQSPLAGMPPGKRRSESRSPAKSQRSEAIAITRGASAQAAAPSQGVRSTQGAAMNRSATQSLSATHDLSATHSVRAHNERALENPFVVQSAANQARVARDSQAGRSQMATKPPRRDHRVPADLVPHVTRKTRALRPQDAMPLPPPPQARQSQNRPPKAGPTVHMVQGTALQLPGQLTPPRARPRVPRRVADDRRQTALIVEGPNAASYVLGVVMVGLLVIIGLWGFWELQRRLSVTPLHSAHRMERPSRPSMRRPFATRGAASSTSTPRASSAPRPVNDHDDTLTHRDVNVPHNHSEPSSTRAHGQKIAHVSPTPSVPLKPKDNKIVRRDADAKDQRKESAREHNSHENAREKSGPATPEPASETDSKIQTASVEPETKTASDDSQPKSAEMAAFEVSSKPAAEIYLDGSKVGTTIDKTTASGWLSLKPGTHTLELRRTGYQPFRESLELRGGERRRLNQIHLQPGSGGSATLTLKVSPLPVKVSIAGQDNDTKQVFTMTEATRVIELGAGHYHVRMEHNDEVRERDITLSGAGNALTFTAVFKDEQ